MLPYQRVIKEGGYIVFADLEWTYAGYLSRLKDCEQIRSLKEVFTDEQMKDCQVNRVVNLFMLNDERFQRVLYNGNFTPHKEIFVKTSTK